MKRDWRQTACVPSAAWATESKSRYVLVDCSAPYWMSTTVWSCVLLMPPRALRSGRNEERRQLARLYWVCCVRCGRSRPELEETHARSWDDAAPRLAWSGSCCARSCTLAAAGYKHRCTRRRIKPLGDPQQHGHVACTVARWRRRMLSMG